MSAHLYLWDKLYTDKNIYKPKTRNINNINIVSSIVMNKDLISKTLTHDILHLYNFTF
jgi:hypothetical protein